MLSKLLKINRHKTKALFLEKEGAVFCFLINLVRKEQTISLISNFKRDSLPAGLQSLLKSYPVVKKSECFWFICGGNIETIEKPNLNKEETYKYIKYKLPELTRLPIEDSVYDIVLNNKVGSEFFKKYLSAFVVKKQELLFLKNSFRATGLQLIVVDNDHFAMRDFFSTINGENKSSLCIKANGKKLQLCIYYLDAIVFSKSFNLESYTVTPNAINENTVQNILLIDKILLEIQRIVDILDRQYAIPTFSSFLLLLPADFNRDEFKGKLIEYFAASSIDKINISNTVAIDSSEELLFEAAALLKRGEACSEIINILQKADDSSASLIYSDIKKTIAAFAVIGFFLTAFGSYYYVQSELLSIKKKGLEEQLSALKKMSLPSNEKQNISNLQASIASLLKEKDNLLSQSKEQDKILQISMVIENMPSNIKLTKIQIEAATILIQGLADNKINAGTFLKNLNDNHYNDFLSFPYFKINRKNNYLYEFSISNSPIVSH